jgi:hypothetical protein
MMAEDREQVQAYQKLVVSYEAKGEEIAALMERNGGHTENMSDADMHLYRQLAQERDDLFNQIKEMEANLLQDED